MNPFRRTLKKIFGVVFINDRKDVRLLLNCFLAAFTFWVINAMQKDYSADFAFPITFEYDKAKYVPKRQLPKKMTVELKGSGWNLIQKSLGIGLDTILIVPDLPRKQFITINDLTKWSETGINGANFERLRGDSLRFDFISLRK